jgi:riboflavin kinase/FMN adenylyltransferase
MSGFVAPAVTSSDGEAISSSRIRAAIEAGRARDAAEMLGRYYSLEAPVIEGKHLGTRIGIPTLNQHIPEGMTVPKKGIYISFCTVGEKRLRSITNIGVRPTVETAEDILCESNILDEAGDMYGCVVKLELCDYRREEMKFSSVEELRDTIRRDIEARYRYTEAK